MSHVVCCMSGNSYWGLNLPKRLPRIGHGVLEQFRQLDRHPGIDQVSISFHFPTLI